MPAFCSNFLEWQTQPNTIRQKERRDEVGSGGKSISQSRKNSGYTYDYKKNI